jgi:AAA+ ATPase superfamily predicted ATPase
VFFDPRPKDNLKDVFDREKEVDLLRRSLDSPLVVVVGLRRTGKTSLVKSLLNEMRVPYLFLDIRKFENRDYIVYKDFLELTEREVERVIKRDKGLLTHLKDVKGIQIAGFSVYFNWGKDRVEFSDLLVALNSWGESRGRKVTIVLDEAQELIKLRGYNILPSIAYAFDNLRNLNFIVTGSQVRLKDKFLKVGDESSPLFGRAIVEIEVSPFNEENAVRFLQEGFKQYGIEFRGGEGVYRELGGNPGWLTYFGYVYIKKGENPLEETKAYAMRLLTREFCNFLREGGRMQSKQRYLRVIEVCKEGCSWKEVKNSLEALEGRRINDNTVYNVINNLLGYSFLVEREGRYYLSDPLLKGLRVWKC